MTEHIYKFENVTKILTTEELPVTLVKNVNLHVERGDFVSITGPSGSGKSSLLYLLGLLDMPTDGRIFVEDINTTHAPANVQEWIRLTKIGFIFQFHYLIAEFTVLENVMLPMKKLGKYTPEQMEDEAMIILNSLDMLAHVDKHPSQLSGGQKQRVAIARSLANSPDILLADEPTGNLDTKNARHVFDIFEHLANDQKKTIIVVTHEPELAGRARRKISVVDGKIREEMYK